MLRNYILDSNDDPVAEDDVRAWGQWFEEATKNGDRTLQKTAISGSEVSTVFLGIDHNFGGSASDPILYETLVFGGELDQEMERYPTKAEALEGHYVMVQRVINVQGLPGGTNNETH